MNTQLMDMPNACFDHGQARSLLTLTRTLKLRSPDTYQHSLRVARISYELAKAMNYSDEDCEIVYVSGLMHDIGKLLLPETILEKPTKLTLEEFKKVRKHPEWGCCMLEQIKGWEASPVPKYVLYHHERFDGKGYPYGLKAESIPEPSQIISIADAFDVMITGRTYTDSKPQDVICNEIDRNRGKQFNPKVVDVFLEMIRSE
ncbi:HD-GYP domain-containing protein [Desertibacillus haloalkaliphilus]|uniref:HD-GYP domain-containing protein n=1 Tax=Desertibacillus haloalkaliphilus TaxID=1328930 RepID=UPI001C25957F|nr:HD-GYP domain-containing protein [Desertibacillus haloalkaliphilus]MBU8905867.1 HD-GYP domain-containing protein [Desertibacillus haloalkaliphilus]